jgi:tripartite-type tricarboxylate transporter receptor subunit TctC
MWFIQMIKIITSSLLLSLLLMQDVNAQGVTQTYPNKPVTIVVAYAPGGLGDVLARRLAEKLSVRTKQSFVVENRPGATGALATRYVAKSKPDGYTLLLGQTGEMVINPIVNKDLGYEASKDFKAVALIGEAPLILASPGNSSYRNLPEFIKLAKAKPGSMTYASSGSGTPGHLAAASLVQDMNITMTHVPYKGAGQAMTDLLGGHVDIFFSSAPAVLPHIESKTLRALAVSSDKRMSVLPEVHTVSEDAIKGFNFTLWGGIFTPTGTPDSVNNLLNTEINEVLKDPSFYKPLEKDGVLTKAISQNDFEDFMKREIAKYSKLLKTIEVKND